MMARAYLVRAMPLYEYRCKSCDTRFEARRSMADADEPVACPDGHEGAQRLLAVFAATGRAGGGASPAPAPMPTGGGCGGHCACH